MLHHVHVADQSWTSAVYMLHVTCIAVTHTTGGQDLGDSHVPTPDGDRPHEKGIRFELVSDPNMPVAQAFHCENKDKIYEVF